MVEVNHMIKIKASLKVIGWVDVKRLRKKRVIVEYW
jgi:hypothetical protein